MTGWTCDRCDMHIPYYEYHAESVVWCGETKTYCYSCYQDLLDFMGIRENENG